MDVALVVLAAGIGHRYGGLKQMDPVGPSGEFIIDYSVYDAIRAGFNNIVFVIRKEIEADFRSAIGSHVEKQVDVHYLFQDIPDGRKKPWGTGHAVMICHEAVDSPFAVINADDLYGSDSFAVLARFLEDNPDDDTRYGLLGFLLRNTLSDHGSVARGVCKCRDDGYLAGITEHLEILRSDLRADGQLTGDELVSMNMWGFKPTIFDFLDEEFSHFIELLGDDSRAEFLIPTVVNKLVAEAAASVRVLETSGAWAGITHRDDKPGVIDMVRQLVDGGKYPSPLFPHGA
jgi:NDP-sugar pyrophosphorylase family protein